MEGRKQTVGTLPNVEQNVFKSLSLASNFGEKKSVGQFFGPSTMYEQLEFRFRAASLARSRYEHALKSSTVPLSRPVTEDRPRFP